MSDDPNMAQERPAKRRNDNPEHRFSHYFDKFLDRVLLEPAWYTAVDDSEPVGGKGDSKQDLAIKRMRREQRKRAMGVKPSALDWPAIVQFDPRTFAVSAICWIELKRGNKYSSTEGQLTTIRLLRERGQIAEVAGNIHACLAILRLAKFRLHSNADNIATEIEARLEAADRAAPAKLAKRAKAAARSGPPKSRYTGRGITTLVNLERRR